MNPPDGVRGGVRGGGRGVAWLVGALLVASVGLASWPIDRKEPAMPMQAWSAPQAPAAPGPMVTPPADARAGAAASAGCTERPVRDVRRTQGT